MKKANVFLFFYKGKFINSRLGTSSLRERKCLEIELHRINVSWAVLIGTSFDHPTTQIKQAIFFLKKVTLLWISPPTTEHKRNLD
jgi:hypothetical protein